MVTLVADKPEGPFLAAKRNVRLLAGHTYFSRFYRAPDGLLVNHHSIARNGQVYFGTLKATAVDREGTLRLTWWPGNERLKHEPLAMALPASAGAGEGRIAMVPTALDAERGTVLEGTLTLPAGAGAPPRGLYIEGAGNGGAAILIHPGGRAELGPIQADGSGFRAEKTVDRELESGTQPTFRLLLKHSLLEFYLNEVLIECFSLAQPATGRIGRIGGDAVRLTAAWRCE
jgi:hypothetical protein